jgi:threonine synthase
MVKQAFSDPDINGRKFLTSANSINIARWLPQQFYYLFAYKQWEKQTPPVISVPSGNFGNICAGILAMKSGLPVKNFIAACNENDILTQYLATQDYVPRKALHTYSNAMDVGDPSNFVRVLEIFEKDFPELRSHLSSACINDDETLDTIRDVAFKYNYIMDPHGAVGYLALYRWLEQHPGESGLFLETAHPVKFPVAVEKATRKKPGLPASLDSLLKKQKQATLMNPDFNHLKEYLLHN